MNKKILTMPVKFKTINNIINTKLVIVFVLGFSSGLPFLLILSTLSIWLTESAISKTQIGLLAWVTISYSCKFLFAFFVDNIKLPLLTKYLGQRRSWMLGSQLALLIALAALGHTNPQENLLLTTMVAFSIGIFSAIQDVVIEAYRIEIVAKAKLAISASVSVLGYRLGMLCSGAGAIYLAAFFNSWTIAYNVMAFLMLLGIMATLMAKEPQKKYSKVMTSQGGHITCISIKQWTKQVIIKPVSTFFLGTQWKTIIIFILFYKFADTILNVMSMPFLLEIGFNKMEIAYVAKTFGIITMICGGIFGAILLEYYGLWWLLVLTAGLQFGAGCLFVWQAKIGYNIWFLFITMGVENLTCGLAQVALMTYLASLCIQPYTAIHYAILSSFASGVRVVLSMFSGWLADKFIWENFYFMVCLSCIISIIMLQYCNQHFQQFKKGTKSILV